MNRFEKVISILDASVGGPDATLGFHGAFWRGTSRDQFVAKKVMGQQLLVVGDGANSNLVKALTGQTPFGADTGNQDADFNRMPSGLSQVAAEDIDFIKKWIDEGCLEDEFTVFSARLTWRRTNAPAASSRTDDIWFIDPMVGWAVNSDGKIIKTSDGGISWIVQHTAPNVYLRCIGLANANVGWVGTLSRNRRLFSTNDGTNWKNVDALPPNAPVAICGISVVSDKVVFCSGTNRPNDRPGMMKTLDGGITWTAWDMSIRASVLIDCYFLDSLHGWVVGGKANEPTPTTRDKLKPVVLETTDGGVTWINRLAGQESNFPFGEWGWKIQFLDDHLGYVSLENLRAAAILKTTDGGKSWQRIKVSDPQNNVNLEGIGFIDEEHGWVGGWGPGGFGSGGDPQGLSSSTSDGGITWSNANEIGLFLNRFRFFGNPVSVGYASGDTVYKLTSDATPTLFATPASSDPARSILPEVQLRGSIESVPIRMNVPSGTKRLSLLVWDKFGEEVGYILDEISPTTGPRVFEWDGVCSRGSKVEPGDYILRLIADDVTASSRLAITDMESAPLLKSFARTSPHKLPKAFVEKPRFTTIAAQLAEPDHDIVWLRNALQTAIQLELATLPPYLVATWTIDNADDDPVAQSITEITREEMLHFGLVCNLLASIDGFPQFASADAVPSFPGPLPGGVRPGLEVALRKLSAEQVAVFMDIEFPEHEPIVHMSVPSATIGEFYDAIQEAFEKLNPSFSTNRQIERQFGFGRMFKIDSLDKVKQAIEIIKLQGEGTTTSPEEAEGDLAHFYRFGEIFHGKKLKKDENGKWDFTGDPIGFPNIHNMADIPAGGYQQADVPDAEVWDMIERFDRAYSEMLRKLQATWTDGTPASLGQSVQQMFIMGDLGRQLVTKPRPDGQGNFGPCFRFVP